MDRTLFQTFIGVDLGGGKGKNTAVAVLRRTGDHLVVEQYDTGDGLPWFDEKLIPFLHQQSAGAVVAIDAPLTLTACVRCHEPTCPGVQRCVDPTVVWFNARANGATQVGRKPKYTPYTQRATEVLLHEDDGVLPRETLGQGMGPLTARAAHLVRALAPTYRLNENLIEVYPKATIWKLQGETTAREYKRWGAVRLHSLIVQLPDVKFAFKQWPQKVEWNDHMFDAVICAYTAYLWSQGRCAAPTADEKVFASDGWIWIPRA